MSACFRHLVPVLSLATLVGCGGAVEEPSPSGASTTAPRASSSEEAPGVSSSAPAPSTDAGARPASDPVCTTGAPASLGTCGSTNAYAACRVDATQCCVCAGEGMNGTDQPYAWECTAVPVAAAGCPAEAPVTGSECAVAEGATCTYCGRSARSGIDFVSCVGRHWERPQGTAP